MTVENEETLKVRAVWAVKERVERCFCGFCVEGCGAGTYPTGDPVLDYALRTHGVWVPRKRVRNVFTNYGVTQLVSALSGGYVPPLYLAIEQYYTTPYVQINAGATSIQTNARVDQPGDIQLVLGAGAADQEVVSFSAVSGSSAPYTYTLISTPSNTHPTTDYITRAALRSDTMTNVSGELQYDATNFPNQRMSSPGGYSGGTGNWVVQFYFPGGTAQGVIALAGMTDSVTIGQGNLHNHFVLGYNNNNVSNDLEIDGNITLTN